MSGKHTPAPWFWALDKHNQRTALMRSGSGDYVATPQADVGDYGLSVDRWTDVSDADAALIEAAPRLLEALRYTAALAQLAIERRTSRTTSEDVLVFTGRFASMGQKSVTDILDEADAAIAQAQGEAQ